MGESSRRLAGTRRAHRGGGNPPPRNGWNATGRWRGSSRRPREAVEAKENEVNGCERERSACEAEAGRERAARDEFRLEWNAVLARPRRGCRAARRVRLRGRTGRLHPSPRGRSGPLAGTPRGHRAAARAPRPHQPRGGLRARDRVRTKAVPRCPARRPHGCARDARGRHPQDRPGDPGPGSRTRSSGSGRGLEAIFPRLFGGGNAYLELTGDDLLDTGVTVMAPAPRASATRASTSCRGAKRP